MVLRISRHAIRLLISFALSVVVTSLVAIIISVVDSFSGNRFVGTMLFWPTIFLDRFFPTDPDYFDLEIMWVSLFMSFGTYTLIISFILWLVSRIKARGNPSNDGRAEQQTLAADSPVRGLYS